MFKRISLVVLAGAMLFSLCACGEDDTSSADTVTTTVDVQSSVSATTEAKTSAVIDITQKAILTIPKDTYPLGTEDLTVHIKNVADDGTELTYGEKVILEKNQNSEYVSAGEDKNYADVLNILASGGESNMTVELKNKFGELEAGEYRLGIIFDEASEDDSTIGEVVYVNFTIK